MSKKREFDEFVPASWMRDITRRLDRGHENLLYGTKERLLLTVFFNEVFKRRNDSVPKFSMYSRVCETLRPDEWAGGMLAVDVALRNLVEIRYVQKSPPPVGSGVIKQLTCDSGETFELTATGLEQLRLLRPPLALQLRAWIAVLPPWLIAVGSVAAAISTIWEIAKLLDGLIAL